MDQAGELAALQPAEETAQPTHVGRLRVVVSLRQAYSVAKIVRHRNNIGPTIGDVSTAIGVFQHAIGGRNPPQVLTPAKVSRPDAGFRRRVLACVLAGAAAIVVPAAARYWRAVGVLQQLSGQPAPPASVVVRTTSRLELSPLRVRAHLYSPTAARAAPALVLLHGAHPRGIDEARLVAFARSLAAAGVSVLTPELPELIAYRIDPGTIDRIAQLARVHAQRSNLRAVGVMGISFAGGLALLAAANAPQRSAIAFVVSVGGHHDLTRLTRYYAGEPVRGPEGESVGVKPHPYGARVMLREHLARFFDPVDLAKARDVLDVYLADQHREARRRAAQLSPRGRDTMRVLLDADAGAQLAEMLKTAAQIAQHELAAASPSQQLADLSVPVFLVHGSDDPIVPSIESRWLERELPVGLRRELVISTSLRHAELNEQATAADLIDKWTLVRFMAAVLREADAERFTRPRTARAR
jgi:pimeloyl-ACP methyl ester carboxylesterase